MRGNRVSCALLCLKSQRRVDRKMTSSFSTYVSRMRKASRVGSQLKNKTKKTYTYTDILARFSLLLYSETDRPRTRRKDERWCVATRVFNSCRAAAE